jgi:S-DNA-T family DNA segregation ATPase FtsK/SpoIIIE
MATRTPRGAKGSSGTRGKAGGKPAARKSAARKPAARKPAQARRPPASAKRSAAKSRPKKPDPVAQLIIGIYRIVGGVWLVAAQGLGSLVRRFGESARDLDQEHRRDGLGLANLGLAIVLAAATWWSPQTGAIKYFGRLVRDGFGTLAGLLPLMFALLACRRRPNPEPNANAAPSPSAAARWSVASSASSTSRTARRTPAGASTSCSPPAASSAGCCRRR